MGTETLIWNWRLERHLGAEAVLEDIDSSRRSMKCWRVKCREKEGEALGKASRAIPLAATRVTWRALKTLVPRPHSRAS